MVDSKTFTFIMLFLLAGLFIGVPYLLFPILIYNTLKQSAAPEFRSLDFSHLPGDFGHYLQVVWPDLEAEGFEVAAYLRHQQEPTTAYLALFANRSSQDLALAGAWYGKVDGTDRLQTMYLEFSTEFTDGTEVNTNNNNQPGAFAEVP